MPHLSPLMWTQIYLFTIITMTLINMKMTFMMN
nr:ATP synthase F0 subunit 8 [Exechonella vieirai]